MSTRDGRWRHALASAWLATIAVSLPAFAQDKPREKAPLQPPLQPSPAPSQDDAVEPPVIRLAADVPPLLLPDATPAERLASARRLLADRRLAPVRDALLGESAEAAAAARQAIAESPRPADLFGLLEEAARERVGAEALASARTLATWNDRDAVRSLVRLLRHAREHHRADLAGAVAGSLTRITGRPMHAADPSGWLAWWSDAEWLPEADWQAALAHAHRERAIREAADRERLEAMVLDLYRRLHGRTPSEDRTDLLREMLESPRRSVRLAGLDLVERALLNGRVVDAALAPPAAAMLADPEPEVRRLAARSLLRFAPDKAAPAALSALSAERDPETAATLMDLASSSDPDARAADLAEPWLEKPSPASDAAANLIRFVLDRGRSPGEAFEQRVREAAVRALAANPTPAVIRLLSRLGRDAELEAIAEVLSRERETAAAVAATRALSVMPGGLARLSRIVDADASLRPLVADALSRGEGGLEAYRFVLRLADLPADARREALHRLWMTLDASALDDAARETPSPDQRAEFLAITLDGRNGAGSNGRAELSEDLRETLTILLADARLEQDRIEDALVAIGSLSPEAQRSSAGADVIARALARLVARREGGEPSPEAQTLAACAPAAWAEALHRLAATDPARATAAAQWTELAEHVRTDEAARAVFDDAARTAGEAVAGDDRGQAEDDASNNEPPEQGGAKGLLQPAAGL